MHTSTKRSSSTSSKASATCGSSSPASLIFTVGERKRDIERCFYAEDKDYDAFFARDRPHNHWPEGSSSSSTERIAPGAETTGDPRT
jgi:hypothetical protein